MAVAQGGLDGAPALLWVQGQVGVVVRSSRQPRDTDGRQRGEKGKAKFIVP